MKLPLCVLYTADVKVLCPTHRASKKHHNEMYTETITATTAYIQTFSHQHDFLIIF